MKWFIIFGMFVVCGTCQAGMSEFLFGNDNYYECILYEMPDAENNQEASDIYRQCKQDYPLSIPLARKESYLGIETSGQCLKELLPETSSSDAKGWIKHACYKVYLRK